LADTFFGWVVRYWVNYWPLFLRGAGTTLLLAVAGTAVGFIIGLLVATVRIIPLNKSDALFKRAVVRAVQGVLVAYIELFRATPMIVQAMVIYYGAWYMDIPLDELMAGFVIISINTGAYMAEIVRGGFISVDRGQTEGAQSIGMTHWQTMTSVVMPQAVRNIMPTIGNEFVINIKDSAVLSVIGVSELYFMTKSAAGTFLNYFPAFVIACAIYFVLTFSVTRLLMAFEKKMDGPANYIVKDALEPRSRGSMGKW